MVGTLYSTKYPNNQRIVSGGFTVFQDDVVLLCDTSGAPVVVNLLQIPNNGGYGTEGNWSTQYKLYIIDYNDNAAVNNITVNAPAGFKINGSASQVLSSNGGAFIIEIASNLDYVAFASIITIPTPTNPLIIANQGTNLPNQPILNFTGAGVVTTNGTGQTIVNIPGGGVLGSLLAIANLLQVSFPVSPSGTRTVENGTTQTTYVPSVQQVGSLINTFDTTTGRWTCPTTGIYNLTTLFSLSASVNFNDLTSFENPNGFISNGVNTFDIPSTPETLDFNSYVGQFYTCISDVSGGIVYCVGNQFVSFNTSHVQIVASYTGRFITAGTVLVNKWLNKCANPIVGQQGNSFHFSVTQIA